MSPEVKDSAYKIRSSLKFKGVDFLRSVDSIAKKSAEKIQQNADLNKDISRNFKSIAKTESKILKSKDLQDNIIERQNKFLENVNSKPTQTKVLSAVLKRIVQKPIDALQKLLLGILIVLAPKIISAVEKLINQFKLIGFQFKQFLEFGGNILSNSINVVQAIIDNAASFDFTDESGRLEGALDQWERDFDNDSEDLRELASIWQLGPKELDEAIKRLERGEDPRTGVKPQETITGEPVESTSGSAQGEWGSLLNVIAMAESESSGGYNAMNRNVNGRYRGGHSDDKFGMGDLTSMTVGEIRSHQNKGDIFASGRYQIVPDTLQFLINKGVVKPGDMYDAATQDRLAVALIENRGVTPEMALNDPTQAASRLAPEWAGLPVLAPQQGSTRSLSVGQSYYAGDGVNQATISPDQMRAGLSGVGTTSSPSNTAPGNSSNIASGADSNGMSLSNVLTARDFNTTDSSVQSPIIKTSSRGMRGGRHHGGIDFGTGNQKGWYCGYQLNGKVSFVGTLSGYGKTVILECGGVDVLFAHLARFSPGITQGASYSSGQPIGEVGNTGRSRGIHLHFEVRSVGGMAGSDIDPNPYVKYLVFGKLSKSQKQTSKLNINDIIFSTAASNKLNVPYYDYDAAERLENQNTQVVMMTQPIIAQKTTVVNKTKKSGGTTVVGGGGGGSKSSSTSYNQNLMINLS